jgi:RNA polymerase-binding transcription factor
MKRAKSAEGALRTGAYRKMLLEKRQNVMAGLGFKFDTLAKMGRVAEEDQAQISHDEFVSLRLNSLDYVQLRLIEEALDRIEAGDYGICLACEEPIPAKRLQALPWARYCVECQQNMANLQEPAHEGKPGVSVQPTW